MRAFIQRLLLALCTWEACIILFFVVVFPPAHTWSMKDVVWFAQLTIFGLVVVGIVALLCLRLGKIGGAIVGLLCGLLPRCVLVHLCTHSSPRV